MALGAAAVVAALLLSAVALGGLDGRSRPRAQAARAPLHVGGTVRVEIAGAGHVLVALPEGWGMTARQGALLSLASPSTCHAATLSAFVDHARDAPERRAELMLGYLAGRSFDPAGLWRGTVAGGRGYAVYDPRALLGVEAVRDHAGRALLIVVHGLPADRRCAASAADRAAAQLSHLLQDLKVDGGEPAPRAVPGATA